MVMSPRLCAPVLFAASLALGGCNSFPQIGASPTSMQPLDTYVDNHPPEPANGLPRGATVVGPLVGNTGQLNSVPVGPVVPAPAPIR